MDVMTSVRLSLPMRGTQMTWRPSLMLVLFARNCLPLPSRVAAEAPRLEVEAAKLSIPFHRYTTKDALARTITFYLSTPPGKEPAAKVPVVLYIQGSGCQSLFRKQG